MKMKRFHLNVDVEKLNFLIFGAVFLNLKVKLCFLKCDFTSKKIYCIRNKQFLHSRVKCSDLKSL